MCAFLWGMRWAALLVYREKNFSVPFIARRCLGKREKDIPPPPTPIVHHTLSLANIDNLPAQKKEEGRALCCLPPPPPLSRSSNSKINTFLGPPVGGERRSLNALTKIWLERHNFFKKSYVGNVSDYHVRVFFALAFRHFFLKKI